MQSLIKQYRSYTTSLRRSSHYNDMVNASSHDKVFYIYYLGRYLSKPLYTYGETHDIYSTEYYLQSKLPFYKLVKNIPIEDNVLGIKKFEEFIEYNKTKIPFKNNGIDNVFTIDDKINIDVVMIKVDMIFQDNKNK